MCDMGFMPAVTELLDHTPPDGQRLLFSATLDGDVDKLVRGYLTDPVTHSTSDATASVTTMEHHVWLVKPAHKAPVTAALASREGRTVVFVRTKLGADRVAAQLREQGVRAAALHGGLAQGARNRTLAAFKDGHVPVLVATDVAARGIHVDDVSLVVQVDPPADHKDYLHRAGRTARAGGTGTVITLALPHQTRMVDRLTTAAGVDATPEQVSPHDDALLAVTRGAVPERRRGRRARPLPARRAGPSPSRRWLHRTSRGRPPSRGRLRRTSRGRPAPRGRLRRTSRRRRTARTAPAALTRPRRRRRTGHLTRSRCPIRVRSARCRGSGRGGAPRRFSPQVSSGT